MIAVRATDLRERITVRQANRLSQNQRVHMAKRLEDLRTLAIDIEAAANYLNAAPDRRLLTETDRSSITHAREAVSAFRETFSAGPAEALQDDTFGGLQRSLKASVRTLSNAAQADWHATAEGDRWEQLAPMLRALEDAAPDKTPYFYKVRKLVDLVQALGQMAGQANPSAETRQSFAQKREAFDQMWDDVTGTEGIPEGLIEFLAAAHRQGGASLHALTDPIRVWLHEHGILDSLSIRIR